MDRPDRQGAASLPGCLPSIPLFLCGGEYRYGCGYDGLHPPRWSAADGSQPPELMQPSKGYVAAGNGLQAHSSPFGNNTTNHRRRGRPLAPLAFPSIGSRGAVIRESTYSKSGIGGGHEAAPVFVFNLLSVIAGRNGGPAQTATARSAPGCASPGAGRHPMPCSRRMRSMNSRTSTGSHWPSSFSAMRMPSAFSTLIPLR